MQLHAAFHSKSRPCRTDLPKTQQFTCGQAAFKVSSRSVLAFRYWGQAACWARLSVTWRWDARTQVSP